MLKSIGFILLFALGFASVGFLTYAISEYANGNAPEVSLVLVVIAGIAAMIVSIAIIILAYVAYDILPLKPDE